MPTKSQTAAAEIAAYLRARVALLYVRTFEEARVEQYLIEAACKAGYIPYTWDCAAGVQRAGQAPSTRKDQANPDEALELIRNMALNGTERRLWIMRDLPAWLAGPIGVLPLRALRNLARELPNTDLARAQAIVVLTPAGDVPPELSGHATVIDWPTPDRDEIASILDTIAKQYQVNLNGQREAAIDAAVGLSGAEAQNCYSRSLVQTKRIDPELVANEKKTVIAREGVLEWLERLPGGLDAVGGLDQVKGFILTSAAAFTPEARAYGLRPPKGILLVGVSGCGKTHIARAIATGWECPLIRWDFGAMQNKYVGDSQKNIRKARNTVDSLGKCVVLVDEIEKALAGATQGAADGGVSADQLGTFLSWMNDRTSSAFVVATANNVEALPPELLRAGRFDVVFWVDLPNATERLEILEATLRHSPARFADAARLPAVVKNTERFSGAEIAALVPAAMTRAFADGARNITVDDLLAAAKVTVPLADTAKEKISRLRTWAMEGRARPATTPESVTSGGRTLDLD